MAYQEKKKLLTFSKLSYTFYLIDCIILKRISVFKDFGTLYLLTIKTFCENESTVALFCPRWTDPLPFLSVVVLSQDVDRSSVVEVIYTSCFSTHSVSPGSPPSLWLYCLFFLLLFFKEVGCLFWRISHFLNLVYCILFFKSQHLLSVIFLWTADGFDEIEFQFCWVGVFLRSCCVLSVSPTVLADSPFSSVTWTREFMYSVSTVQSSSNLALNW